ncbi:lactonase family protein [Sphingobium sp.]|uniref:lactonase family protein n=1 Tax=Sphingobium sp. TaxID=1912891 RepID=UPI0028BD42C2|nr:lactonase family protein [Sphingobium sp.]
MLEWDRRTLLAGAGAAALVPAMAQAKGRLHRIFTGSYSWGPNEPKSGNFGPPDMVSEGIYSFPFDSRSGRAGPVELAAHTPNPANLILHPNRRILYAGSSRLPIEQGQHRLTAFAIEQGRLIEINHLPSGGGIPTQGAVSRSGRFMVTTNFDSDNIVSFSLRPDGGLQSLVSVIGKPIGAIPAKDSPPTAPGAIAGGARQTGATDRLRPHMALLSPDERFAIATQMSTDSCVILRFDAQTGTLIPHGEAHDRHGSGPRHIAFAPDGRFLYSANEEGSTITAWRWDARAGALEAMQQLPTLPAGTNGANKPAHVAIHPSGRFAYVNNRGHGSIAIYGIDQTDGRLAPQGWTMLRSPVSWHFLIDPSGGWLIVANQSDSSTQIFAIDPRSGALSDSGQLLATPCPTCLTLV